LCPNYGKKLRVVKITSWPTIYKLKTWKNTCNCRYFQIYEHFTPKILFGIGSHVHLEKIPHGPHIFWPYFGAVTTPNWQKTGNDEVSSSLCTDGKWAKTKKRVCTATKTIWTMISVTSIWQGPIPTRWYLNKAPVPFNACKRAHLGSPMGVLPPPFQSNNDKLRVAGRGRGNTRARRTNTHYRYSHP